MKSKPSPFHPLLFLVGSSLLPLASSHAQLTWDANGPGAGQTNGGGAWLGANLWWNGSANQDWISESNAIFGGPNTAGGAVTLASPATVSSMTFNPFTGTYTMGSLGQMITLNAGITMNAGSGAVSLSASPITLGAAQTWTNNSSSTLTASVGLENGGNLLTIGGSGAASLSGIISGAGGLTKNGPGRLTFHTGNNNTYAGPTTINGGVLMAGTGATSLGPGNLILNGGVLEHYWSTNFTRTLGTGNGQVQIPGGASGFSENGATGMNVILNNSAASEVVWGSSLFNPSALVLQVPSSQAGSSLNFQNKIDLNGTTRTVAANGTALGVTATISGVIRNSSGTAAGLTKTGPGLLFLTAANTFDGGTTISQGTLRFDKLISMPAAGEVAVQTGAVLTVDVGGAGEWTTGASGNGTIGGLLTGLGGQSGSTVSYIGNVTLVSCNIKTFALQAPAFCARIAHGNPISNHPY